MAVRPRGGVRRDLRLSLGDASGYGAMAGVAEVYLPAFGLALGMSPVLAGLLASVPLLAGGVLQLVAPRAIARTRSLRGWVVGCTALQALAFVPLIVVALTRTPSAAIVFRRRRSTGARAWPRRQRGHRGWRASCPRGSAASSSAVARGSSRR